VTIEIKPEVKAAIDRRLQNGGFHDVDELLTKALDALPDQSEAAGPLRKTTGNPPFDWRKMRGMARGADSLTLALMQERSAEKAHDEARVEGH
jgi:Arc/MetJ-type ribon-helix-helix transcriptional regulator